MSIFIAVLIFTIIVVIHEFGHFIAAKKCGILVEEFAIGMGPKLVAIRKGETLYTIRILPIGGFCKMLGDDENNIDQRAFNNKSTTERFVVIVAGVVMNFLLAFILFIGLVFVSILYEPTITGVSAGSPAEEKGLMPGDKIVAIDNTKINIYEDLAFALNESRGEEVQVNIIRDGVSYQKAMSPEMDKDGVYKLGVFLTAKAGILLQSDELPTAGFMESIKNAYYRIAFYIRITITGLVRLVNFSYNPAEMAGPIGIVGAIRTNYNENITYGFGAVAMAMAHFMAILSANLAIFNLLPLPALDGGRLVFILIETIARKPIPREKEGMIHFMGFVLLMILAAFVAYNDIIKLF